MSDNDVPVGPPHWRDITDEEVALIRAESEAYDRAHPNWRDEAEARLQRFAKDTMPPGLEARGAVGGDPELKRWIAELRERLRQKRG